MFPAKKTPAPTSANTAVERELGARALAAGLAVGALLCIANLYTGLKTGIWDSGQITASVLAFALLRGRLSRRENNTAQTAACAAGAMPAAAGLLGAIPALQLLGREIPAWGIALWGVTLAVLGILFALALRRRLIEEERLAFPTGVATAEVIEALHGGDSAARGRTRTLLWCGLIAALWAWFRGGRPALIPGKLLLPVAIAGVPTSVLSLGVSTSPLYWGVGAMVGMRTALSLAAGSLLAWVIGAPWLVRGPLRIEPSWPVLFAWMTWPGVALVAGAALIALLQQGRSFAGAVRDLRSVARRREPIDPARLRALLLAGLACVATVVLAEVLFGLHPLQSVFALALSALLASVCARSAGVSDWSPLGSVGQLTQVVYGGLAPGQPAINIAAGSIPANGAAQTGVLLWSLRAGHALGASPARQGIAALIGALLGGMVCVPAYLLLVHAHGLGTPDLPVPTGLQWKALGDAVARGTEALPPGALAAVIPAAALGALLAALSETRLGAWLPSAVAMGTGILLPPHSSVAILLGAVALRLADRARPGLAARSGKVIGAGAIAGDSMAGVAAAMLAALGFFH